MADEFQYWDSPLFICYLRDLAAEQSMVSTIDMLLQQAEAGGIRVITSAFTLAEVRPYADRYTGERFDAIEELFHTDRPWLRIVGLNGALGRAARRIGEQHPQMSVADSVHVATAVHEGADVLFTLDGVRAQGMRRKGDLIGFTGMIGNPALRIEAPVFDYGPLFRQPV